MTPPTIAPTAADTIVVEHWSAHLIRIGNQAVRAAQERNRCLGIANWYSLNGRLVSDGVVAGPALTAVLPSGQVQAPALCELPQGA